VTREDMDYLALYCRSLTSVNAVLSVTGNFVDRYRRFSIIRKQRLIKETRTYVACSDPWVRWYREGMRVLEDRSRS